MNKKKQITYTLVCLLILLIPNIACMILSTDLTYSWMKEMVYFMVVLVGLLLPLSFLKKRTYLVVAGLLILPWIPIEISSLYLNKMTTSSHYLALFAHTNWIEAQGVLQTIWPLLLPLFAIWILYIIVVCQVSNEYLFSRRWRWIGAGLLVAGIIGICSIKLLRLKVYKIYPYDIYIAYAELKTEEQQLAKWNKQLSDFRFGLEQKQDTIEEHYILMIGEAARYDHFHINGYSRPTSPCLDTTRGIYSLQNMYSEANSTYPIVGKLITRADILNPTVEHQERTIVEAYQEVGYQTAWLSCKTWMDYVARIAQTADFSYEQVGGLSAQVEQDIILADRVTEILTHHPAQKSFFVLHTMGSHVKYNQRYPQEFEEFTPAIKETDGYSILSLKNKDKVINAYDNTILYTDYVLSQLIQILQQQNGICGLVYISDHGENLLDDERNLVAHSSYEGTIHEAHVPCFVWLNDAFRQTYPDKVAALEANIKKQVQSDVLFYSLADMGALDKIVDTKKSIFSPELQQADTIRMLTGNGNIVQLMTK